MPFDLKTAKPVGGEQPSGSGFDMKTAIPVGGTDPGQSPSSMKDYLIDQSKKGVIDFAALPGLIADVGNLPFVGVGKLAGVDVPPPTFGTQWIRSRLEPFLGVKNVQPPKDQYGKESPGAEYLGTGARYLGAAAAPAALTIAVSEAPFTTALVELAATLSSAEGAVTVGHVAKQLGEQYGVDPNRAQEIGQMVGGMIGPGIPIAASRGVTKGAEFLLNKLPFSKEGRDAAQKALASAAVRNSMEAYPPSVANLQESSALSGQIQGFKPTLGQATGAPGVVSIEEQMARRSPEALSKMQQRENQNVQAIQNFDKGAFPGRAEDAAKAATERYHAIRRAQQAKLDSLDRQIAQVAAKYDSQPTAEIGAQLRSLRDDAQKSAKAIRDQKYRDVYDTANAAGVRPDVSDVVSYVRGIRSDVGNKFQDMPGVFHEVLSKWGKEKQARQFLTPERAGIKKPIYARTMETPGETKPVSFEELHSLYKEVNADLATARMGNSAESRQAERYLVGLKDKLQSEINKFESPQYGSLATKLRDANATQRKYAQTFYEGLGGKMERTGRYGEITPDEKVVSNLVFKPGEQRGLEEFFSIYGDNPQARQLLKNGVYDMFYKAAVRDGQVNPTLAKTFIRNNEKALSKLPELRKELESTTNINDALLARRAVVESQKKVLDRTVVAKIAGTEDVDGLINKAMKSPSTMRALLSQSVKTKDGSEALARAVASHVQKQSDPYQYLVDNAATLKPVLDRLGPKHYDNLVAIAKAIGVVRRTEVPTSALVHPIEDIGTKTTGTPFKSIFSQARAVAQGRQSRAYMVVDLIGKYLHKFGTDNAFQTLEEAIYNPEIAQDVLRMMSSAKPSRKLVDDFAMHMFNHGVRFGAVQSGLIQDQEKQNQPPSQ